MIVSNYLFLRKEFFELILRDLKRSHDIVIGSRLESYDNKIWSVIILGSYFNCHKQKMFENIRGS